MTPKDEALKEWFKKVGKHLILPKDKTKVSQMMIGQYLDIAIKKTKEEQAKKILNWINNCRKTNGMWRKEVDEVFNDLEDFIEQKYEVK